MMDDVFHDERTGGSHRPHSARELIGGTLGSDPYARIDEMRAAGKRKARAEGVAYQLEAERHVVLALVKNEIEEREGGGLTESKLERLARADKRYRAHVKAIAAAVEERELATSEYFAIRSELEWDRASVSHHNALSRLEEPT